jgi:hypothetical protein
MRKIPKKWRELPKEERYDIPIKYFNIDRETIEKIRKIADPKKRLIEAARIQYELFGDIHSYLTVWIAGYLSDVMIREKFGSTQKLLNLFFKPEKFPDKIKPSWADIKRKIKIPEKIDEKLAEETGIHIGDGNLYVSTSEGKFKSYSYGITGDLTDEYLYHKIYIKQLIKDIYNLDTSIIRRENKNSVESRCKSKAIVTFKNKILGLPVGSKKGIKIPKEILKDSEFQKRCVVGIIDTDFSITKSLAITGKLHSLNIIRDMKKIFDKNKIDYVVTIYKEYGRFYIKKESAIRIIEEWKLKNQKHLSKYNLLKKFNKFIPYSTTPERLAVLDEKLGINELEVICKKRRVSIGS